MSNKLFHTYQGSNDYSNRTAEVFLQENIWGCRFYIDGREISEEIYVDHSESWAEDCAENFVLGIKNV